MTASQKVIQKNQTLYAKNQICNILTDIFCLYFYFYNYKSSSSKHQNKILSPKKLLHQRYG